MSTSMTSAGRPLSAWPLITGVLALALWGCASETPAFDAATRLDAASEAGAAPDAGPPSYQCQPSCESAADCSASPESAALFECASGACLYLGCDSDSQCASGTRCAVFLGGARSCIEACSTTDDCAETGAGTYGPSDCIEGVCRPLGCPDDAYCARIGPTYRCLDRRPGDGVRACEAVCAGDADCDLPGWNGALACIDGVYGFPACNPDEGCADRFGSPHTCVAR